MLTRLPQPMPPIRLRPTVALIGLLGAVNALAAVARGHARLEAVSAEIAAAIITTAVGLLVVFPGIWIFNHLKSQRRED